MMAAPDPRTIRRALGVLERLPAEALADLVERLIDRLDAITSDPDLEDDPDCCEAADDQPDRGGNLAGSGHLLIGDADDAEESGDENGPDDEGWGVDEPQFPRRTLCLRDDMVGLHRQIRDASQHRRGAVAR